MKQSYTKAIIYGILIVLFLVIIVVGMTYAYFSASATNNNKVVGNTSVTENIKLEINRVDTGGEDLIPMKGVDLAKGITSNCTDINGNNVCHIYEIKVTNGPNPIKIKGKVSFTSDSENIVYGILDYNQTVSKDISSLNETTLISGTSYTQEGDLGLVSQYKASEVRYFYIVVWLSETGSAQEDVDAGKSYTGTVTFNAVGDNDIDGVTATFSKATCFAKGTKITMGDNSLKNIEDIKKGDIVKTYNHLTGTYEKMPVYIAYKGDYKANAFTLHFDNGQELSIVGIHDLFEKDAMKYVKISYSNVENYVGHYFYDTTTDSFTKLIDVTKDNNKTEFYSIYTKQNHNAIANNMLSIPDDIDFYLNLYEFNSDLTVNKDALQKDIEKYGLNENFDFEFEEEYEKQNARLLNIIVGKQLATKEQMVSLWQEYQDKYK